MQKCFYLICPTDCLESTINKQFKYENYFYSSLGNSFVYDYKTIISIKQIIEKYDIKEICFVLSMDNKIILDALGEQEFSNIGALQNYYNEIVTEKEHSKVFFQERNSLFPLLSYYLNKKINELQIELTHLLKKPIKIEGKIYNKHQDSFMNIYADLICLTKHSLN